MKVGDKVRSLRIRPDEIAVVTRADIKIVKNEKKNRDETRTSYTAEFDDKTKLIFYGFDINRFIFKVEEDDGQIHMSEFIDMEG
jgi:hypothetical protein